MKVLDMNSIHTCESLPKISSSYPEVLCENIFLKNFTKFTLFWKNSQNSQESIMWQSSFFSDTSSLLDFNCYIREYIIGVFLCICGIKKSCFEKCRKSTGKHLRCSFFLMKLQALAAGFIFHIVFYHSTSRRIVNCGG